MFSINEGGTAAIAVPFGGWLFLFEASQNKILNGGFSDEYSAFNCGGVYCLTFLDRLDGEATGGGEFGGVYTSGATIDDAFGYGVDDWLGYRRGFNDRGVGAGL